MVLFDCINLTTFPSFNIEQGTFMLRSYYQHRDGTANASSVTKDLFYFLFLIKKGYAKQFQLL